MKYPLKTGDTKHPVIARRFGSGEHVQRSFAKTLPFDRLGTDGRAKGKIGVGDGRRIILGHRGEVSVP